MNENKILFIKKEMQMNLYKYNHTIFENLESRKVGEPIYYVCDGGSGLSNLTSEVDDEMAVRLEKEDSIKLNYDTFSSALKSEIALLKLHIKQLHKDFGNDDEYYEEDYNYDIECATKLIEEFEKAIEKLEAL